MTTRKRLLLVHHLLVPDTDWTVSLLAEGEKIKRIIARLAAIY